MTGQGHGRWETKIVEAMHPDVDNYTKDVWVNAPDQKFIVFSRVELLDWLSKFTVLGMEDLEATAIYDAVVIRTQDVFAGPALHAYASSISVAATLLKEIHADTSRRLQNIADYFHFRSLEADDSTHKLPD